MFNDKYDLTLAVLEGRKTQTRRMMPFDAVFRIKTGGKDCQKSDIIKSCARYKEGELVAVAQSYRDLADKKNLTDRQISSAGYKNKMFANPNLMPHHIRITNIRIERLQDISEEDCLKEGIKEIYENGVDDSSEFYGYAYLPDATPCVDETYNYPQEAYASLIDRISGKGTWESNPYVYVYDFELID